MSEPSVSPPRKLGADGRCCGRKTHPYKTKMGMGSVKDPHSCCFRCNAEYDASGRQRASWAWIACEGGFTPTYPDSDGVEYARLNLKDRPS